MQSLLEDFTKLVLAVLTLQPLSSDDNSYNINLRSPKILASPLPSLPLLSFPLPSSFPLLDTYFFKVLEARI